MKKKWKQIASFLLAAALLLGMIPALSVTTNAEANSGIRGATSANADGAYLSDLEWVSAKHYNDAHGAAFGVQKNHCSEYPWYCDTPGDPSTAIRLRPFCLKNASASRRTRRSFTIFPA